MNLKFLIPIGMGCAFVLAAIAQDRSVSTDVMDASQLSVDKKTRIIGEVSDGTRAPEQPRPEQPIDFNVIDSHSRKVHVKLAPEMPGLPAPEGMINMTVELVQKPVLEEPPPLPKIDADDPAVAERVDELTKEYPEIQILLVSASVYDKSNTRFQIHSIGSRNKSLSGCSNIDLHHFSGFGECQVEGEHGTLRRYSLMMAVSDVTDPSVKIPKLPSLAANGPTFVVDDGDIKAPSNKQIVEDLHNLYRVEGKRLAEAHKARADAYEKRKAYLLANPPKPKDVTVRFWNQETVNPR